MKINFKYSFQLEYALNGYGLSEKSISEAITDMEKFWQDHGPKIETCMFKLTKMKFKSDFTYCYINSKTTFSDPLVLKFEDKDDMHDNLIHELIHILLTDNYEKIKKQWLELIEKHKAEKPITQRHIGIHALHKLITQKLFPERIERIAAYSEKSEYVRSWEIVNRETPEKIVGELFG